MNSSPKGDSSDGTANEVQGSPAPAPSGRDLRSTARAGGGQASNPPEGNVTEVQHKRYKRGPATSPPAKPTTAPPRSAAAHQMAQQRMPARRGSVLEPVRLVARLLPLAGRTHGGVARASAVTPDTQDVDVAGVRCGPVGPAIASA